MALSRVSIFFSRLRYAGMYRVHNHTYILYILLTNRLGLQRVPFGNNITTKINRIPNPGDTRTDMNLPSTPPRVCLSGRIT